jgi:hypothetical protein
VLKNTTTPKSDRDKGHAKFNRIGES